jgi:hypothetical protein
MQHVATNGTAYSCRNVVVRSWNDVSDRSPAVAPSTRWQWEKLCLELKKRAIFAGGSMRRSLTISLISTLILALALLGCRDLTMTGPVPKLAAEVEGTPTDIAEAVQRSIEEFVTAQGDYCLDDGMGGCLLFIPPVANYLGTSDPGRGICAAVDYAGLADEWITAASGGAISFGTTFSGSVTERPMDDGRAEVHVRLNTRNALTWAIDGCDFATSPLIFGHRAPDVLAGADAALGDVKFQIKFVNTAPGAPLPDIMQLLFAPEPGQEVRMLAIDARATGTLRAAFGVPDGTPGHLTDIQSGLFMTHFMGATGDGFPVERITIQPVSSRGRGHQVP